MPAYFIGSSDNNQLGNVRKNSKKHDLVHLYVVKATDALALEVIGKYS
jgi:hypothetical protein